ncbi:unnamed protein product [Eruca vesicaria subsp. sativa]|uniref:3'-5' exonuclease domain-containing protein n=1 Tax=Eruca vesicaria subsp. sativa TaxID=29727 RepID=A0ABC8IRD4_ERUVS|nr:unnamed protein product [Eruca vesicaria subsp. sativa]
MSFTIVDLGVTRIKTTVTRETSDINRLVKTFLSNNRNRKKIIGLDTERARQGIRETKTVLLQLCDGDNCLMVQLPSNDLNLPLSLFNFLNFPDFTFVGISINKSLNMLYSEFGLTCKNVVEIGRPTPDLMTDEMADIIQKAQTSTVLNDWSSWDLNKNQIKLAVSNAYLAFGMGNILLAY